MKTIQRILCPVDLSKTSLGAIDLATQLAKQNDAKVCFIYVAPQWLPQEAMIASEYIRDMVDADKKEFEQLRPSDPSVEFEHEFVSGNAGPEIVRATKSADMVVLCTHGRSSIFRFIMGSVAQYVLRNSKCPVVLVKGLEVAEEGKKAETMNDEKLQFVTDVMHQVPPIHAFDKMDDVLAQLEKADETAAPVVDELGRCIGILTSSDIEHFHVLLERFAARDESVVDEMFEVDKFGQRRATNLNFDQVQRHMTKEVVSVSNEQTVKDAIEVFEANPGIHHLVVVDEDKHAVGIVDSVRVVLTDAKDDANESGDNTTSPAPNSSVS